MEFKFVAVASVKAIFDFSAARKEEVSKRASIFNVTNKIKFNSFFSYIFPPPVRDYVLGFLPPLSLTRSPRLSPPLFSLTLSYFPSFFLSMFCVRTFLTVQTDIYRNKPFQFLANPTNSIPFFHKSFIY